MGSVKNELMNMCEKYAMETYNEHYGTLPADTKVSIMELASETIADRILEVANVSISSFIEHLDKCRKEANI